MSKTIQNLKIKRKKPSDYIGNYFNIRGCTINVTIDDNGLFYMLISKKGQFPTHTDVAHARYKYLPDDIYMIEIFPPMLEYVKFQKNTISLWEIKKGKNDTNKNKRDKK